MQTVYFNKQFVPLSEAKVSIRTNALHYGSGVFEGIRAYWNATEQQLFVFKLPEHYERMVSNCRVLKLKLDHDVKELCAITVDLLRRNQPKEDTYIRPIAYISSEGLGPKLVGYETGFAIYTIPLGDYIDTSVGIRVGFSSWRRISDNTIPARCKVTGGYVNSALARTEAMEQGYDEALFLTQGGFVSEGSAENLFLVRSGTLITPDRSQDILEGITRDVLLTLCQEELGLTVIERQVGRTELYVADEVFLCGTGAQVAPVIEVDRRPVGSGKMGPITARIQQLYFEVVKGNHPKYRHWCTPVY
ncbi:MAG: branched chain amino acid aminotransferase [candidate division NC10 bacterium RIFCSPLOWO2_12_FULL_66_18]|nr:MAG: branched chain amino acid aminotransferase [candidate division NC10 bacterium RIFCSPLOWO2_02_FULL_66_22]OGB98918.1 MAG: branched chain amino acid aminotransferase [candidate division NC10 bacterium RIFCSPLOWO2_12_FULL_66_18]